MASKKKASTSKTKAKAAFSRRSKRLKKSEKFFTESSPLMEREVKFSSFEDINSLNSFNRQGWGIMYKDFSTPKMFWVTEFYENFHNQNELSVQTTVEGVLIHLTPAIIGKILDLPLLSDVSSRESYATRNDDNRDEVMRFFTGDPLCHWPEKATSVNADKFVNPIHRVGMNIMNFNLYPTANRGVVTLPRILFLYDMFNNRPIDLPHHLFHVMCRASVKRDKRYILPFPSLVTKLLSHFNVPKPKYFKAPERQRPISISSLKSCISHLHQRASVLEHPTSPNPIDPFPENDATTTPQSPPAEPLLQALRAFHDGMRQDMDRRIRAFQDEMKRCMHRFHDEMRQDMDRRMRASQDELRQQISSMETRMAQQSDKCTRSTEKDFGAEDDEEGADPSAADDTRTAFPDELRKQISSMETRMAQQSDECTRSAEEDVGAEEGADPTAADDTRTAFPDELRKQISSIETRMAQQSDACTRSAEEDVGAEEGADRTAADDTLTASRHNLLDNMGDPPCPCSYEKKLLILDVNGLLLAFKPLDTARDFYTAVWRPYCMDFLYFCFVKFDVALWSSRKRENLDKLIEPLCLTDKLIFNWDQSRCTKSGFNVIDSDSKPLFLKDLRKVWEKYEAYNAANTLLLDDSPYKALVNPPNTAVFPKTFQYDDDQDTSLGPDGDLRTYLERLAMAENVQKYVEQNPFGQHAITESDPNWKFYSKIIEAWS